MNDSNFSDKLFWVIFSLISISIGFWIFFIFITVKEVDSISKGHGIKPVIEKLWCGDVGCMEKKTH